MSGEAPETLTVNVKLNATETKFKVKLTTTMNKIFRAFAKQHKLDVGSLKFIFDGERVMPEDTPKSLELEEGGQIDCFMQHEGGSR